MENTQEHEQTRQLSLVGVVCLGGAAGAALIGRHVADVAYCIGEGFGHSILLTLLYIGFTARRKRYYPVWLVFVLVAASSAAVNFSLGLWYERAAKIAANEVAAAAVNFSRSNGAPGSQAVGEMGELSKAVQQLAIDRNAGAQRYQAALQRANCGDLLTASRYVQKGAILHAKSEVAACRTIVETFMREDLDRFEAAMAGMQNMSLPPEMRASVAESIRKSLPATREIERQTWNHEFAVIDAEAAIIDFLSDHQASWTAQGDKLLFNNDRDLGAYQALYGVLEKAARESLKFAQERKDALSAHAKELSGYGK